MKLVGMLAIAVAVFLVAGLVLAEEKEKPKVGTRTGLVAKADDKSIALVLRGDGGDREVVYTLDTNTKVLVETNEDEVIKVKGEDGVEKAITRAKVKDGKSSDVKSGQKVVISAGEDKKVVQVKVLRENKGVEGKPGKREERGTRGEIGKVDAKSITIIQRGDSGEKQETYTIDADTKVIVESDKDETIKVKGENGVEREITRAARKEGKVADLQVGQKVEVTPSEKKATQILVLRARKKEGDK